MNSRERFEQWLKEKYFCTDYSLKRTVDGVYYNTVSKKGLGNQSIGYASVQMLWEAWRDGQSEDRTD